jgi:hypothetical protein
MSTKEPGTKYSPKLVLSLSTNIATSLSVILSSFSVDVYISTLLQLLDEEESQNGGLDSSQMQKRLKEQLWIFQGIGISVAVSFAIQS